ncbi:MAG: preprotein translocase subunit SecE [Chloroflexi bacterium]|nr:MAG: preprotein translocase subunit SecE [Chloroflexota bacterium]TMG67755.1 MAG: preprotein translocase subunit SecE [Chloroflexota bacterium]
MAVRERLGGSARQANVGLVRFAQESWSELGKVTWPERQTVIRLTAIVIVISAIVALYILGADKLFELTVNRGFLNQPGASPTPGVP